MEINAVSKNISCSDHLPQESRMDKLKYGLPDNYNEADHPPVRYRNKNSNDTSETQRKRRSKNRLSNRRSTGYTSKEEIDAALKLGPNGDGRDGHETNDTH